MRNLALMTMMAGFLAAGSLAQAAPPPMAASAPMAKKTTTRGPAKPRTPISLNCSQQADTKALHGKDREKFRKSCMKSGK